MTLNMYRSAGYQRKFVKNKNIMSTKITEILQSHNLDFKNIYFNILKFNLIRLIYKL